MGAASKQAAKRQTKIRDGGDSVSEAGIVGGDSEIVSRRKSAVKRLTIDSGLSSLESLPSEVVPPERKCVDSHTARRGIGSS